MEIRPWPKRQLIPSSGVTRKLRDTNNNTDLPRNMGDWDADWDDALDDVEVDE